MSQTEFRRLTGFKGSMISWYENGHIKPSPERLVQLLRLAATDDERGPILKALETCGILATDLHTALLADPDRLPEVAVALPVPCGALQTAMCGNVACSDNGN